MLERTLCLIKSHVQGKEWVVTQAKPLEEGEEDVVAEEVELTTETLASDMKEAIVERFLDAGFQIIVEKRLLLSSSQAETLLQNEKVSLGSVFSNTVDDISSSAVIALILEKDNAVSESQVLVGNVNPDIAKASSSGDVKLWPIRAQFGIDIVQNAVHVSSSKYAASYELNTLFPPKAKYERTFALVKPDSNSQTKDIVSYLHENGFIVVGQKELHLTDETATELLGNDVDEHVLAHYKTGPVTALAVEKMNGIVELNIFTGPIEKYIETAPKSIRAVFGTAEKCHHDVLYVSSNTKDAAKHLELFFPDPFPLQRTFAMIKPGVADEHADEIFSIIESHGFTITAKRKVQLTPERAGEFYEEHRGRSFYEGLCGFMSSDPIYALVLSKACAIKSWRTLCGPTNSHTARKMSPQSIRAKFGLDGQKNAVHGADSPASVIREVGFHFPRLNVSEINEYEAIEYLKNKLASEQSNDKKLLNSVLTEGLTALCRSKPAGINAVQWLGKWLLENNPNKPGFKLDEGKSNINNSHLPSAETLESQISNTSNPNTSLPNNGLLIEEGDDIDTKVVFVLGGPGSGKGTQCQKIVEEFGYTHISTGDLLRAEVASGSKRGNDIKKIMASGGIVPMQTALVLLKIAIKKSENNKFLIDGYPRELSQAFAFEQQVGTSAFVLFFDAPDEILIERCLKRGESSGRSDDNATAIKRRLKVYHQCSKPVVDFYLKIAKVRTIDSSRAVDEVYADVRKLFLPEVVFLPGGPGSGTTTLCKQLVKEFEYTHLSIGDILRKEINRGSKDGILIEKLQKEGRLVPETLTIKLLKKVLFDSTGSKYLLDGFPRTSEQAIAYEDSIGPCDFMISLDTPLDEMKARCVKRGRSDDTTDAIRQRLSIFKLQTEPVINSYKASKLCHTVDASLSIGSVYREARKYFLPDVVFVLGGPGSGKGTQCERISKEFGYTHLSAGDLLRSELARGSPDGVMIDEMIRKGQIVPVETTLGLLRKAMTSSGNSKFLIDGFPRAADQAEAFESIVTDCSMVLYIDVEDDVLESRLLKRGVTSGRSDDNAEAIKRRLNVYHMQSMPVINHYARRGLVRRIDGNIGDADMVYGEVRKLFMKKVTFVLGGPGAGKGTMCERIVDTYGFAHLSTGDLLRAEVARKSMIGQSVANMMKEGKIVPQSIIMKLVLQAMANSKQKKFLLDGFPRSVEQAEQYEKLLGLPERILYLDVPEDVMLGRLISRGKTSGRADDNEATIKKRFDSFKKISYPVLEYYNQKGKDLVKTISAVPPPTTVFESLRPLFAPNLILIAGSAGSGRGELAGNLGKYLGYTRLRVTQLLETAAAEATISGETIRDCMRNKKTVPVSITIDIIKKAIMEYSDHSNFVIDGYPRLVSSGYPLVHDQLGALEKIIAPVKVMLHLDVTEENRLKRCDIDSKTLRDATDIFVREKLPVVRYFESVNKCVTIDANKSIENVFKSALSSIEN